MNSSLTLLYELFMWTILLSNAGKKILGRNFTLIGVGMLCLFMSRFCKCFYAISSRTSKYIT